MYFPVLHVGMQCLDLYFSKLSDLTKLYTHLKLKLKTQYLQVPLNPNFAVFVTQTTDSYQITELPATLRGLFRLISVPQPDFSAALRSLCVVLGFKSGKLIADRLIMVHKLVVTQMYVLNGKFHLSRSNYC